MSQPQLSPEHIRQAAHWLARLWSEQATAEDEQACVHWRQSDPANEYAWQQLQQLQGHFDSVPARTGHRVLASGNRLSRRQLLVMTGVIASGAAMTGISTRQQWQPLLADQRTATGEMRSLRLADGTQLKLNTATSLNLHSDAAGHRLRLLRGELLVELPENARSLQLSCRDGVVQAHHGRLCLRQQAHDSQLAVYSGQASVELQRIEGERVTLNAGEAVTFSAQRVQPVRPADTNQLAWIDGRLVAERMPLTHFLAELGRYRQGMLRADPDLARLQLTGVFSLRNTDVTLARLPEVLPVRLRYFSRYWVKVEPA